MNHYELLDLFFERLEEETDTEQLAESLEQSGVSREEVIQAQKEASELFSKTF